MFIVTCSEIGYPKWDPYHSSEDQEECERVCRIVAEKYTARSFVEKDGKKIFMSDFSSWNKFLNNRP